MHFNVTFAVRLLAILFISQTICDVEAVDDGHGSSGSGSGSGSSGSGSGGSGSGSSSGSGSGGSGSGSGSGGSGSGSGSGSGGSGSGSGSGGSSGGNKNINMGTNMTFALNGMPGIQLPFPFFPPFGCDTICQPIQFQVFQQQLQETVTPMIMTTQAPTTRAPTTTPPPKPTTPPQKPPQPATTFTSQTVIMYPNWCQGWCKFFYQPPPQPVYYQPNCLLFSWMGMGTGMSMGMHTM